MTIDADAFIETVREQNRTALSRLGSSKALYADTGGEMDPEVVFEAAALAERAAMETFEQWADSEDGSAADRFRESAAEEQEHYDAVVGKLSDDVEVSGELPAIQSVLREFETTIERAGGFIGRTLAAEKSKEQLTAFFVGQADPQTAQLFREMGDDLDAQLERGCEILAEHCDSEEDEAKALNGASRAILAAYDEYTERLESMGVNPKPVC